MFHTRTHTLARARVYLPARKRTHSDRRDYEVGLRGEHISFLVIINAAKNVAKTCSAFGKYIPPFAADAAGFCSGALYRYLSAFLLFLHPLSPGRVCLLPFCLVAPCSSFSSSAAFSSSIAIGVARQQPVHRGQPADFLPAVILFRFSRSLSLCLCAPG